MEPNDGYNKEFTDKPNEELTNEALGGAESWLNENGQPDFKYLQSLATDGSPEALEKLRSIAEELDVEYDDATPPEELIGRMRSVTEKNDDDGPESNL